MRRSANRVALSGLLTALMLVLGFVERQFPLPIPVPGIKLGLANSVLLYAVYMLGARQGILLMLLKVVVSGFLFGNLQAMVYSFSGGVLSLAAMILVHRMKDISPIGVSIAGACFFNIGQVLAAAVVVNMPALILTYLPILLLSAVVTGALTGVIAKLVMKHLRAMTH